MVFELVTAMGKIFVKWDYFSKITRPVEAIKSLRFALLYQVGLTHWGQVTHKCISKLTINGSNNGLSPGRCQAIIWTNAGILSIGPWGTNLSEILIGIFIQENASENVVWEMLSIFFLGL